MSQKVINAVAVLVVAIISLAILANSMTKPLGHDEQMYCTSGVLLAQGKMIYRDFSYVAQMPCHPFVYAALFKVLDTTHYLLVGRIFSSLCDILVVVCIVGIYRRVFSGFAVSGAVLGLAAACLYVFNPFVDYASGFAWNHDAVILCVVLSFWLFVTIDFKQGSKRWPIALIGGLLSLATCMRITTALVQLLFFVMLLSQSAESVKQRLKRTVPFLVGTAIVLIWPVWVIALAPRAFFLNVFSIPVLNSQWLHEIGMIYKKFDLIRGSVTMSGYPELLLIAIYLCVVVVWQRRRLTISHVPNLLLAALLPIVFVIIALIPLTMWLQYLAAPVPFLVISFAYPLLYLRKLGGDAVPSSCFKAGRALIIACVTVSVILNPVVLSRISKLFVTRNWTAIGLHRIAEDIAERTKEPKLILTLAPLYALEGGCDIYPQLSAGPFVYRVADSLSASDLDVTHAVGPKTLKQLLEESPPSAVIVGAESELLEKPLLQAAVKPDWETKTYEGGLVVYFKP